MNMSRSTFYDPAFDLRDPAKRDCDCAYCTLKRFGVIGTETAPAGAPVIDAVGVANPGLLRDALDIITSVVALTIQRSMEVFGPAVINNQILLAQDADRLDDVLDSFKGGISMTHDLFAAATVLATIEKALDIRAGREGGAKPAADSAPVESIKDGAELESLTRRLLGRD